MNKKLMTLGVAAAVGLAGFAALPVLAASFGKTETVTGKNDLVDGEYSIVKTIKYDGKVNLANGAIEKAELIKYVKGTDEKEGTKSATLATAEADPTITATPAHDKLTMVGTYADFKTTVKALGTTTTTAISTDEEKADVENLKELTVELTDAASTLAFDDVKELTAFVKKFKNLKKVNFKLDPRVTVLNLDGIKNTDSKDLKGIVSFTTVEGVEKVDSSKANDILANLGVKFSKWAKDTKNNDIKPVVAPEKPEVNPEDKKDDDKKAEEAAGNKTKVADKKGLKAPDTGIVK